MLRLGVRAARLLDGRPFHEVTKVGGLLGEKTVLNEFVAYSRLSSELAHDPAWLSERGSPDRPAYALCGFANFGSIGIQDRAATLARARAARRRLAPRPARDDRRPRFTTCIVASAAGIML